MQVTQVSMTVDGAQVSGAQTWLLDGAAGEVPQRVFRQVLYLRFALDGYADGILVSQEQTRLRGRFLPYEYDVQQVTNPALVAQVRTVDNAVLVQLEAPRQLRAVALSSALAPGASSKLTVHRVDGTQVVEEATTEIGWTSVFTTAATTLSNSAISLSSVTTSVNSGLAPQVARASTVAVLGTDFTDVRFGLRLRNAPAPLRANQLAGLTVRSYPSAPRIGLADLALLATPTFFLRLAGEISQTGESNTGQVAADKLLADALQDYVDAFFAKLFADAQPQLPVLPSELKVAMVLESDAPCYLHLDEFTVGYQLVRRNFPDNIEKQVLRFAGTAVETQRVNVRLPAPATVTAATLTVAAQLGATALAEQATAVVLSPDALTQASGIHLGLERWAAQPLIPAQAHTAQGVVVGLLALVPDTQISLEIDEDWQGQPAGKKVTTATVVLAQSGQRRWQTVRFAEPVLLFAQPYWLLLKAVHGAALWLSQPSAAAIQMVTQENQRWQLLNVNANTQGLVHWLTPVMAGQQVPLLALQIAETPVLTSPVTTDNRQTYDLTAALNGALANKGGAGLVDLPLTITTGAAGLLTLYPPVIVYSSEG